MVDLLCEESAGDGRKGLNGDKEVGARGEPRGAVFGETAPWDDGMDVRVVLELSPPGREKAGKPGQVRAEKARIVRETFEGVGRGCAHGLVGHALMRAEQRA